MTLIAPTVEIYINSAWTDITSYVRADEGIQIQHGVQGEAGQADPARCAVTVDNSDGRFTPTNPTGPYYGQLTRNVPLRVRVGLNVRFVGEVSEFPPEWDPTGRNVETRLVAGGPLRRLVKGRSTASVFRDGLLARHNTTSPGRFAAYWPMEEGVTATYLSSALDGGTPLQAVSAGTLPEMASFDPASAAGFTSAPITTFNVSPVRGSVPDYTFTGSATYGFLLHIPEGGTTNSPILLRVEGTGTAYAWTIQRIADSVSGLLRVKAAALVGGSPAEVLNAAAFVFPAGATHYCYLELTNNGADVDWSLTVLGLGNASGTLAGYNVGKATNVYVGGDYANPLGAFDAEEIAIGHIVIGTTDASLDGSGSVEDPLLGYTLAAGYTNADGETVAERMTRLAGVAGVALSNVSGTVTHKSMGRDTPGGVLERMRRAESSDVGGILHDAIDSLSLRYISRAAIYSDTQLASAVQLNYADKEIHPPLNPTDDDFLLTNDVTVVQEYGTTARQELTEGALSTDAYPDGIGRYETTHTLPIAYNYDPVHWAGWILNVGTTEGVRYPRVTVDLAKNTGLVANVTSLRPGDWIRLVNLPTFVSYNDPELIVLGWAETIGPADWTVTFNCAPADPYRVFEIENYDDSYGRLDSDTTVTNEALDTTETGVDYTGDTWITTATRPGDFPFYIMVGGEQMRVTSAVSGTFTVVRSINGVVKSHASGTPIRLYNPPRLAL